MNKNRILFLFPLLIYPLGATFKLGMLVLLTMAILTPPKCSLACWGKLFNIMLDFEVKMCASFYLETTLIILKTITFLEYLDSICNMIKAWSKQIKPKVSFGSKINVHSNVHWQLLISNLYSSMIPTLSDKVFSPRIPN